MASTPKAIFISQFLIIIFLIFSGCKKSPSSSLPLDSVEIASNTSIIPPAPIPSTPLINLAHFTITNLKIDNGAMLKLKIWDSNQQLIAESQLLQYSPEDAMVTADGEAYLQFIFDSETARRLTAYQKQKIVQVLYEVVPDSAGKPVETEISKQ